MTRIVVPIVAVLLGLAFIIGVLSNTSQNVDDANEQQQASAEQVAPAEQSEQAAGVVVDDASEGESAGDAVESAVAPSVASPSTPTPVLDVDPIDELKVVAAESIELASIGSGDETSDYEMQVDLTPYGAGMRRITLSHYRQEVAEDSEAFILLEAPVAVGETTEAFYPYAMRFLTVNGATIGLQDKAFSRSDIIDHEDGSQSVTYSLTLTDGNGSPLLRIERVFRLYAGSYDLSLDQRMINLSDQPLNVVWEQNLQGDVTSDGPAYLGERRQVVTAYVDAEYDPRQSQIFTPSSFNWRTDVVDDLKIWSPRPQQYLAWLAAENRYFAAITHTPVAESVTETNQIVPLHDLFPRVGVVVYPSAAARPDLTNDNRELMMTATSGSIGIPAGESSNLNLAIYAGPRESEKFAEHPYSVLRFDETIRYSLGGPCAVCTFQWLARLLLTILELFHDYVFFDWGIAIICLVAIVRLLLHPITKRSQISMMTMGKQMQSLAPEMEKLKKKYKDDQSKLNQEMMKLYRERGVNPANMLGCLPMFFQMPIWIALYAMLYFAIELRHQPAFYGIFQYLPELFSHFLADLSGPDRFIQISDTPQYFTLIFINFDYSAINILPLLMGIVMFVNMKFTTPPPMNEQQAQQQKIMKIIPLMFPFFLYSAPAGLTLYIFASTSIGIIDSYLVRRHVKQLEEDGHFDPDSPNYRGGKGKKQPKEGGFFDRLQKAAQAKQEELIAKQQQQASGKADRGNRGPKGGQRGKRKR